jgi:carboxyl-terminal processing protease
MVYEVTKLKEQKVDGIVVDLRSNGGGSLDESIAIAGLFFDKGPVVQIKDQRGGIQVQKDEDPSTLYDGPLMVMINRHSASASEIFAGAIQDYKRGLIVGDTHTFGKGTVQNLNDIDEKLGAIKVTISKFYRPLGSSTQLKGVESDVVLPDLLDEYEVGEKFYDYALPWEKLQATNFKQGPRVTPELVTALRKTSAERVKTDKGFAKIFADIKEFKDGEASRMKVSLKEEPKDAKTADKKKDKKKADDEDSEDGNELTVEEDFHLQETLRVAGDYLQLLNKRPLGKVTLPSVEKAIVASEKKSKEPVPAVPGVPDTGASKKTLIP